MQRLLAWLLLGSVALSGCSQVEPQPDLPSGGSGGSVSTVAGASGIGGASAGTQAGRGNAGGVAATGGAGAAGSSSGGSGGVSGLGGTGGVSAQGGTGAGGASGTGGVAGGASSCVPDSTGALATTGDVVHDPKSCLDWMRVTQAGVNYAAAETFCNDSSLGGFDDWRIPNASELASLVTLCGKYPPEGPIDMTVFDLQGDGYWTTTPAGEPNKVCAIGMANAGGYYHYGTAGPQVVRCVRGQGMVQEVTACTTAQGCKDW